MKRLRASLWVACSVTSSRLAFAQAAENGPAPPAASRAMALPDAVAYAHAHQPLVRAGLARVAASMEAAKVPTAQWLPLVDVTGQVLGGTANNTTASYVNSDVLDIPRI